MLPPSYDLIKTLRDVKQHSLLAMRSPADVNSLLEFLVLFFKTIQHEILNKVWWNFELYL